MRIRTILNVVGVAASLTLMQTAGMAQNPHFITSSYTNTYPTATNGTGYGPPASAPSPTTGLQNVLEGQYQYCSVQAGTLGSNAGKSLLQDPKMIFPGNPAGTGAQIQSNIITTSNTGTCWVNMFGQFGWPGDNNWQFYLTNVHDMGFWIYFTNTTELAPDGTLGRIIFFLTRSHYEGVGGQVGHYVSIPASALGNWVQIDLAQADPSFAEDIAEMELHYTTAAGFYWEYDNWGVFNKHGGDNSTFPFTNIFWIANPYIVAGPNPPFPVKMQDITGAYPGLTIFSTVGNTAYGQRENIRSSPIDEYGYSWVNGPFPVSYSFTVNNWPVPLGDELSASIYLISDLPTNWAGIALNLDGTEYLATNVIEVSLSNQPAGGVTWGLSYKTNAPKSYMPVQTATVTNTTGVGAWTVTFHSVTNVTLTGPGTLSTNFNLPDPYGATAMDFSNSVYLSLGVSPGNTGGCNDHVSFSDFSVTGITNAFDDNFIDDYGYLDTVIWDTINAVYPSCVQMVAPGNPYWVRWAVPLTAYSLYVTPSLEAGSAQWDPVNFNASFPASTNWVQLVSIYDLPATGTNAFFALKAAP